MATDTQSIVIIGGGFAGTTLARALDGKLPRGHELLLISEESHTTFNPMLPEAVGASIFPEQVVAPQAPDLRRMDVGNVFPNDITHLRFTRSAELDAAPAEELVERAKSAQTVETVSL